MSLDLIGSPSLNMVNLTLLGKGLTGHLEDHWVPLEDQDQGLGCTHPREGYCGSAVLDDLRIVHWLSVLE